VHVPGLRYERGTVRASGGIVFRAGDTAKAELKEVDEILGQGKSEQQIIDAFVTEYGTTVYVEPPKKGFGLVAWLMPLFYSVLGLGLVVFVVRKWAVRSPSAPAAASGANVPNEALERARARAAQDTED